MAVEVEGLLVIHVRHTELNLAKVRHAARSQLLTDRRSGESVRTVRPVCGLASPSCSR